MTPNQKAFLDLIAWSEIGPRLLAASDNGYNVLVGSTPDKPLLFDSYADHPNVYNQECNSTAAGRYQFLSKYWRYYKATLRLPDFGPDSQDIWALQLVSECGALGDVDAGRVERAIQKCKSRWASLPGAGYAQHENKLPDLIAAFKDAGGVVA